MQIFMISPNGYLPIRNALTGLRGAVSHGWQDTDAGATQIIGVVEIDGRGDGELIASALEAAGILVLPDHRYGATLPAPVVTALSRYGVQAGDTTAAAMQKVQSTSGFPPHKIKRFS